MRNDLVRFILDTALSRAGPAGAGSIQSCRIGLGELSEITADEFRAEWQILAHGTPAEHASLEFRRIPAEMQCMACFEKYHPDSPAPACPQCGSVGAKILSGEECFLESIQTHLSATLTRE